MCEKCLTDSASFKPNKPIITPIIIVLNAWARPERNVTLLTSFIVQFSFLPIASTGNQWLGITACNKLNNILPVKMLNIFDCF